MLFDCQRCGAKETIGLPSDEASEVVCIACQARQSRRGYEVMRLQAQLVAARERAASAMRAAQNLQAPPEACPECGDDLFTLEHGCPRCGHGKKSWLAQSPGVLYAAVFIGVMAVGVAALFGFGTVMAKGGPIVNLAFIAGGAALSAFGVRAIRSPTTLQIAQARGPDAFGMQQYGPSRPATREQGTLAGAICLVVGAALVVLGVFVGALG